MEDQELQSIRQARLGEMRGQNAGDEQKAAQAQAQQDEARSSILGQILLPEARERLSRISLVRAERARQVEEYLIRMAQSGQLRGKVTEPDLVRLLDQVAKQDTAQSKIVFNRRTDSDDEDYGDFDKPSAPSGGAGGDDDDDDFFD